MSISVQPPAIVARSTQIPVADSNGMVAVKLPSGAVFPVHSEEVGYFEERVGLYTSEFKFTNVSDLAEVDRVLQFELMVYRWSTWLSQEKDWWGGAIDPTDLRKSVKETSAELRQVKKLLGIDRTTRDSATGTDSVSSYITNLGIRAKEFMYMRQQQFDKTIELFMQLQALMTLSKNCDAQEQREMHVTPEDVLDWINSVAIPEFQEIDAYFRSHIQRAWIRSQ